jgi:ABC-type transporter Mla subunit MlaD
MTRHRRRLLVGLALVLAAGAALVTVLRSSAESEYELVAVVESANGIIPGAQVGGVNESSTEMIHLRHCAG